MILPILDMIGTASGNNPLSGSPSGALIGENGIFTNPTGAWDKFKNGNTNEVNKQIAEQNLAYQRENLDYNRALNEEIFNRADTAYQRQIADMRAAGLNPLMAQGGAETGGSATPTESLHNEYQHQDTGTLSTLQGLGDLLNTIQNYEIGFSKARESRAQADSATAQATVDKQTAMDKVYMSSLSRKEKEMILSDLYEQEEYNQYFGINKGMSEQERLSAILSGAIRGQSAGQRWIDYDKNNRPYFGKMGMEGEPINKNYEQLAGTIMAKTVADGIKDLVGDVSDIKGLFGKKPEIRKKAK